ncbi:MAG: GHKL domain-containing protein [Prevotellaceae bacterium]|jgi:nitrogen fixation/metabolism regulation signal transduction histidine kinase|nr:GHKL domain-containing protein [Prevotellaceae bacterium]
MKNRRRIRIFAVFSLCAIFFILSQITTNSLEKGVSADNAGTIEKILRDLQDEGRKIIARSVAGCPDGLVPNFDSICPQRLSERGVFIFVIDTATSKSGNVAAERTSDRIRYWSENLPVTSEQLDRVTEESKYMYLGNGWYVAQAFRRGAFKYVTLILIAREYFYQNQFLRNEINPAFDFPENIIILPLGDTGIPVKDSNGVPLFVVNSNVPAAVTSGVSLLFRWLAVIAGCVLIMFVFCNPGLYAANLWYLVLPFIFLLGLRAFVFLHSGFFRGDLYLFAPSLYADSEILPSLGDLLLHLLFLFMFTVILYTAKEPLHSRLNGRIAFFVLLGIVAALFLCAALYVVESLAFNSEISFKIYRINDVTVYTFVAYFVLAIVFAQLCLFIYLHIFIFGNFRANIFIQGGIALLTMSLLMKFRYENLIIFALFMTIYFLFSRKARHVMALSSFVCLTVFISLYVSYSLITNTAEKEHKQREALAKGLIVESDPVAEMSLKDMEKKITADPYVRKILCSDVFDDMALYETLSDKYFRGYLQRYEFIYHVCRPHIFLHIREEDKTENCIEFFMKEKNKGSPLLGSTHFRFMNNYWGRIHYLGDFDFFDGHDTVYLFLELYSKHETEYSAGYPELLQFEPVGIDYEAKGYSYAKYSRGKRVSKVGAYDYSFELTSRYGDGFFEENGYSHYLFRAKDGNVAIMSFPKLGYSETVSFFSYSFVLFIVLLFILLSIAGLKPAISTGRNSYRLKITVVILTAIIGSLTTLTVAMLAYIASQSEKNNIETIHSKMQSTIIELDQSLFDTDKIVPEMYGNLEATLVVLSNAFSTDLNMYDMTGNLLVSSRNEIFDRNLTGRKMNRKALHALSVEKQSKFIDTERIGTISYYSSYTTYYNRRGDAVAYLNILFFNNPSEFRSEMLSLTGAMVNIYIFLILIGVALAVFISNQITRPLDLVRRKMARLNFADRPEPIDYRGNNELGDLVRVYNRMIEELADSAKVMAENERESAWREMARQIAHEIKNPLTPMKLNIQLALRMKDENRSGWQEKMDAAIKSTLEQIDILSYIASEFSNFARMGKVELEKVDLAQAAASAISLFAGYGNTMIKCVNSAAGCCVKANREQLQKVLTNLLKNSIQAVENIASPEITLTLEKDSAFCIIRIEDNGAGVPEEIAQKLFHPNFTTKSGGTGLGLAISKSIVESFGGSITFVPLAGGACFEIKLIII